VDVPQVRRRLRLVAHIGEDPECAMIPRQAPISQRQL
jgi:hypothetical protein